MKITLVTHHFPPHFVAGAEQYALRVCKGLQNLGHSLEVVTIESITEGELEPVVDQDDFDGIPVWRLRFDILKAPDPFEWRFRNPQIGDWLKEHLRQSTPDLVYINGGYLVGGKAIEAALDLHIPTVLILHEFWFMCPLGTFLRPTGEICHKLPPEADCVWCMLSEYRRYRVPDLETHGAVGRLFSKGSKYHAFRTITHTEEKIDMVKERRRYLKSVLERVDLVISPSQFLLDKVAEAGFQPRKAVLLRFGLDPRAYEDVRSTPVGPGVRFGYFGQIVAHKGIHHLVRAFKQLTHASDCSLQIFGKLPDGSAYVRTLKRLAGGDERIQFRGGYSNNQVVEVMSEVDVVVTPSVWFENRPSVIVEAFAAKRPVIAPRLGGMAELVTPDVDGLQYNPGEICSLASQMQRLVDDPALIQKLKNGITPGKTLEDELNSLVALFEEVIRDHPAG